MNMDIRWPDKHLVKSTFSHKSFRKNFNHNHHYTLHNSQLNKKLMDFNKNLESIWLSSLNHNSNILLQNIYKMKVIISTTKITSIKRIKCKLINKLSQRLRMTKELLLLHSTINILITKDNSIIHLLLEVAAIIVTVKLFFHSQIIFYTLKMQLIEEGQKRNKN